MSITHFPAPVNAGGPPAVRTCPKCGSGEAFSFADDVVCPECIAFAADLDAGADREAAAGPLVEVLPPRKSSPHGVVNWHPSSLAGVGMAEVTVARSVTVYSVAELECDLDGRAFRFSKLTAGTDPAAESYEVFVCRNGQDALCGCRGFLRHGHCKHIDTAAALLANGWV